MNQFVYIIESFPRSGKMNWIKDCLDFVEVMTKSIVRWSPEINNYYIVMTEQLLITELYNDFGLVAKLTLDVDGVVHLD